MMPKSTRATLVGTLVVLVALVALLQSRIDPLRRQPGIEPPQAGRIHRGPGSNLTLPFEYSLAAVSGFRQVVAGVLWVRADSFFHSGNYDAILPLLRIITWLDPNFLDVYSTGAWHLMYNFTDEQQRSDRRYLPAGLALLYEGQKNNPNVYDMFFEAGWNYFDKIKDYDNAVVNYQEAVKPERKPDYTRAGHGLAHSLERSGRIDESIRQWETLIKEHQRIISDPASTADRRSRAQQGIQSATRNLNMMKIRKVKREDHTKPPVDAQFAVQVVRVRPKVLEVSGRWNLVGAKSFDKYPEPIWGPVEGARVEVRLQDEKYKMPDYKEFTFEVDPDVTIMQDQVSVRGGAAIRPGSLYIAGASFGSAGRVAESEGVHVVDTNDKSIPKDLGVPLRKALAGGAPLSAEGRRQLEVIAGMTVEQLRGNADKLAELEKAGYHVGTRDFYKLGTFKREIDMSKDPKMYSFKKDRYELTFSFSPRNAPEFVQDRIGWSGEGLTDKKYLVVDKGRRDLRMLRKVVVLSREDLLGEGRKVLEPMR